MTPLICAKCEKEIEPGSMVEFVGLNPSDPDNRIMLQDNALIIHKECPEGD